MRRKRNAPTRTSHDTATPRFQMLWPGLPEPITPSMIETRHELHAHGGHLLARRSCQRHVNEKPIQRQPRYRGLIQFGLPLSGRVPFRSADVRVLSVTPSKTEHHLWISEEGPLPPLLTTRKRTGYRGPEPKPFDFMEDESVWPTSVEGPSGPPLAEVPLETSLADNDLAPRNKF